MIECIHLILTVWGRLSVVLAVYCFFCLVQSLFLNGYNDVNFSIIGFLAGIICLLVVPVIRENIEKASN